MEEPLENVRAVAARSGIKDLSNVEFKVGDMVKVCNDFERFWAEIVEEFVGVVEPVYRCIVRNSLLNKSFPYDFGGTIYAVGSEFIDYIPGMN